MAPDLSGSVGEAGASSVQETVVLRRMHSRVRMSVIVGSASVRRFAWLECRSSSSITRTSETMFAIVSFDSSIAPYRWPRAAACQSSSPGAAAMIGEAAAAALGADSEVVEEVKPPNPPCWQLWHLRVP